MAGQLAGDGEGIERNKGALLRDGSNVWAQRMSISSIFNVPRMSVNHSGLQNLVTFSLLYHLK